MALDPGAGFLQRLLSQTKEMHPPLNIAFDQLGLLEHFEMAGNGGLGRVELLAELTGAARLAPGQCVDHRTARLVRKGLKSAIERRCRLHSRLAICLSGGCQASCSASRELVDRGLKCLETTCIKPTARTSTS